jgi:hypothetical protein
MVFRRVTSGETDHGRIGAGSAPTRRRPAAAATGSFSAWKSAFQEQLDRQFEDIAENLSNPAPAAA